MNLTVNGVDATIESGPLTSLLDVLREELGVTSPKAGCEQGGCGDRRADEGRGFHGSIAPSRYLSRLS